jgi:hypothetical protein
MNKFLYPEIIQLEHSISEAFSLLKQDCFACSCNNELGFGKIDNNLTISFEPIVQGFPDDIIYSLGADEKGKFVWAKQGYRGFVAANTENKKTIDFVSSVYFSFKSAPKIFRAYLLELSGEFFIFDLDDDPFYCIFDATNNIEIIPKTSLPGKIQTFVKLEKTKYLLSVLKDNTIKWFLADITIDGFSNLTTNNLTEELSKKQFKCSTWKRANPYSNKILLGRISKDDTVIPTVALWEKNYEDVKIEPLLLQCPQEYIFDNCNWTFSLDGKWICNIAQETGYSGLQEPELVFFHVDPKYPQKISPPVFALKNNFSPKEGQDIIGCFVEHSVYGMLFLDFILDSNSVFIYKMQDALPIILEKLKK